MKLKTFDEAQLFFREIFEDFAGACLDESHIKIGCNKDVFTSVISWLEEYRIPTPEAFGFYYMQRKGRLDLIFTISDGESLLVDLLLDAADDAASKVKLPLEVFNDSPIDAEKAWEELDRLCRGC